MPLNIRPRKRPTVGTLLHPSLVQRLLRKKHLPSADLGATAAKKVGVTAFWFCIDDVDLVNETIHGLVQKDQAWSRKVFSYPDVVYQYTRISQLPSDSKEQIVLRALLSYGNALNTLDVIGKWECYEALSVWPELKIYLPETRFYHTAQDLHEMLSKHGSVLAKQCYGLGGMHMSRISSARPGVFYWEASGGERKLELCFDNVLARTISIANGSFILQQEIDVLAIAEKRHFVRSIVCKDIEGRWQAGCNYLIMGGSGQFAVNRHQGGSQTSLLAGLKALGLPQSTCLMMTRRINQVALRVAEAIDATLGRMGELGLDLVIDKQLRLWLLEINALPHKDHLPFPHKTMRLWPFVRIMEYCCYLDRQRYHNTKAR